MRTLSRSEQAALLAVALVVTGVVVSRAWVSDDCFITLRYVANTVHGHGAVFNLGERVQAYTHPAWFLLLAAGSFVFPDPVLVAFGACFLLTFLTMILVGRELLRHAGSTLVGAGVLGATGLVWGLSDPWVSFQTSGLENSLSHLLLVLVVAETWVRAAARPGRLVALSGLLVLTRPDFAVLVLPLVGLLIFRARSASAFARLAAGALPACAWLAFAGIYYHDVLPNSFYAKVGIFPSTAAAVGQGLAYLYDWLRYDPLAAGATALVFAGTAWKTRAPERIALLVGLGLHAAWIVEVGGDFMRGRFFTPILTASIFAGGLTLVEAARTPSRALHRELVALGAILALLVGTKLLVAEPVPDEASLMIVNERKFYPGYTLGHYLQHRRVENPYLDLRLADVLRDYAAKCGPVTVHDTNPGTLGYLAGPDVSIIDTMGITDSFVAKLPRKNLVSEHPRPGHPLKAIPLGYLLSRRDVALLPDWTARIARGDCDLAAGLAELEPSRDQLVVFP